MALCRAPEHVVQLAPLVEDTELDDEDDEPEATQGDEHPVLEDELPCSSQGTVSLPSLQTPGA